MIHTMRLKSPTEDAESGFSPAAVSTNVVVGQSSDAAVVAVQPMFNRCCWCVCAAGSKIWRLCAPKRRGGERHELVGTRQDNHARAVGVDLNNGQDSGRKQPNRESSTFLCTNNYAASFCRTVGLHRAGSPHDASGNARGVSRYYRGSKGGQIRPMARAICCGEEDAATVGDQHS